MTMKLETALRQWRWVPACVLLAACANEQPPGPAETPVPPSPVDWCPHVTPGPAGSGPGALAMSSAHALVRFFSPEGQYVPLDEALANALEGPAVAWDAAARAYADALEGVCALPAAAARELPATRVEDLGGIAVLHPGTGEAVLPPGTRAVAIDLRGMPAAPGLEDALARAIAVASTRPVPRASQRVRHHVGLTDEVNTLNVYANQPLAVQPPPYAPSGAAELPVALLTGPALPPAAALFAVDLRLARRAWLFGEPVVTAVAESRWAPIGAQGLAMRVLQLEEAGRPLPDLLPADQPVLAELASLPTLGEPGALDLSVPAVRAAMTQRKAPGGTQPRIAESPGIARAGLVIAHGALRRFYPYFPVVGDGIDARLVETLAEVDGEPLTRLRLTELLRRFGTVLQDGHGFVFAENSRTARFLPAIFAEVEGAPVVRRSQVPELRPGDTVVSIGPWSTAEWYTRELARTSAATPGYRFVLATRRLRETTEPLTLGLRALNGTQRTVEVAPMPYESLGALGSAPSLRRAGSLGDLGAPSLYYLNLSDQVLFNFEDFLQQLRDASGARGLVLDMRGFPGINPVAVAQHLMTEPFVSAFFHIPLLTGPDVRALSESRDSYTPESSPSFTGPIVLLVGPQTASRAENFSIMLVAGKRVRVVGQRSAGTNGSITNLMLPGRIQFMFTGTEVRFPDRSTFHGVGIVPDVEVKPTASDLATGRDPELLKAIELLQSGE